MSNSQQFSSMTPFRDPAGLDGGVYGGAGGPPPPVPPPPGPGHTWGAYQQHWPPFPPVDPSRPPPGPFDPARRHDDLWSQSQWQPPDCQFRGQFPPHQQQFAPSHQQQFAPSHQQQFAPPHQQQFAPSHQPRVTSDSPAHVYSSSRQSCSSTHRSWSDEYQNHQEEPKGLSVPASDEGSRQRVRDEQWLQSFLLRRKNRSSETKPPEWKPSISQFREQLHGAVRMVSELQLVCQILRDHLEDESVWRDALLKATEVKSSIEERLSALRDPERLHGIKRKLLLINRKRVRIRRRKVEQREEEEEREARRAEREAAVDKWQMKRLQEVEEKNREKELKLAADSVLSEVRKKQADSKRMQDILKSLEKLRKLRKEAAARKGMFPEKESDTTFEGHVERLRSLIGKRTAVYAAEEKALRVMLEGEQEEERKRDREKRQKKEKEKLLQKKRDVDSMLFGGELAPDRPQPFQDYYTQAERSFSALIQIRREWDQFLVPAEHPDGTSVPMGWVLPDQPADDSWATALEK